MNNAVMKKAKDVPYLKLDWGKYGVNKSERQPQ
jgi:hypothetical protein